MTYANSDRYTVFLVPSKGKLVCVDAYTYEEREIKLKSIPFAVCLYNSFAYVVSESADYMYAVDLSKIELTKRRIYYPKAPLCFEPKGAVDIFTVDHKAYMRKVNKKNFYIYDIPTRTFYGNSLCFDETAEVSSGQDPRTKTPFLYAFNKEKLTVHRLDTNTAASVILPYPIMTCVCIGNKLFLHLILSHTLCSYTIRFSDQDPPILKLDDTEDYYRLLSLNTDGHNLLIIYGSLAFDQYTLIIHDPEKPFNSLNTVPLEIRPQICRSTDDYIYVMNDDLTFTNKKEHGTHFIRKAHVYSKTSLKQLTVIQIPSETNDILFCGNRVYDTNGHHVGSIPDDQSVLLKKIKMGYLGYLLPKDHPIYREVPDCNAFINYNTLQSDGFEDLLMCVTESPSAYAIYGQYGAFLGALASCNPYACAVAAYSYFINDASDFKTGYEYYILADKETFRNLLKRMR